MCYYIFILVDFTQLSMRLSVLLIILGEKKHQHIKCIDRLVITKYIQGIDK